MSPTPSCVATPPEVTQRLVPEGVLPPDGGLGQSPIVNVHLVLDRPVTDLAVAAVVDSPIQFIFDRTGVERAADRPVPLHLPVGSGRVHRRVVGPARPDLLRRAPGPPPHRADGASRRRRRHPRARRHVPGRTRDGGPSPAVPYCGPGSLPGRRLVCHRVAGDHGGCRAERRERGRTHSWPTVHPRSPGASRGWRRDHVRPLARGQRPCVGDAGPRGRGRSRPALDEAVARLSPSLQGAGAPPPGRRREAGARRPLTALGRRRRGGRGDRRGRAPWPSS